VYGNKETQTIDSDIHNLGKVEKFLEQYFKNYTITWDRLQKLMVCVSEGISNAIIHGNGNDIKKVVRIEVDCNGKEAIILIEDEGKGFNKERIPNPTQSENIKKEKGRGIFIIRSYASEVTYKKKGRLLRIKFDLSEDTVLS